METLRTSVKLQRGKDKKWCKKWKKKERNFIRSVFSCCHLVYINIIVVWHKTQIVSFDLFAYFYPRRSIENADHITCRMIVPQKMVGVLSVPLNWIWLWGSIFIDLQTVEYLTKILEDQFSSKDNIFRGRGSLFGLVFFFFSFFDIFPIPF